MLTLTLSFLILSLLFLLVMSYRNSKVYAYRFNLINKITVVELESIVAREFDGHWRWDEFYAVTYQEMVSNFWKPLNSFYDKSPARKVR